MKRIMLLLSFSMLLTFSIGAEQLYTMLENSIQYSGQNDTTLEEILTLTLKYNQEISETLSFSASGWAQYSNQEEKEDQPAYADLQRLSLLWESPRERDMSLKFGRMLFADTTGYILNEALDGFQGKLKLQDLYSLKLGLGYSGLTNDQFSTLVKTQSEYLEENYLSPARLIWQINAAREDSRGIKFYLNGQGQNGLEDKDYISWYAGGGATLPVNDLIVQAHYSYNGGFTPVEYGGQTVVQNISGHLVYGAFLYYPQALRAKGFNVSLSGLYSSGEGYDQRLNTLPGSASVTEPDGTSTLFTPISKTTMGSLMETIPGNLIRTDFTVSFIPLKGSYKENIMELSAGTALYFRPVHGPVNVSGLNPLSDQAYLATEIRGKLNYRPFSDLSIAFGASVLLPDTAAGGPFEGSRKAMEWDSGMYLTWLF